MSEHLSTRARLAAIRRHTPEADVTELREQLQYETAEYRVRQLAEQSLSTAERVRLATVLLSPENNKSDA